MIDLSAIRRRAEAALCRNALIHDDSRFNGVWIAVPDVDFYSARTIARDDIPALLAEVERLRAALTRHARHDDECGDSDIECRCGLAAARRGKGRG